MGKPIAIEINEERVRDLLCTGFEGGVGYWCRIDDYEEPEGDPPKLADWGDGALWPRYCWYPLAGGAVIVTENCGDRGCQVKQHRLDRAAVDRGLQVMAQKYPRHFANWMKENDDAETGDVFIQCCVLGEIIYG